VRQQLLVAAGERLAQTGRAPVRGHAVEFRLNAEDPSRGFMPSPGTVARFRPPLGPGVRVDTHVVEGYRVPPNYDSLVAKLVVWDADRDAALDRARRALHELEIDGIRTTRELFLDIVDEPLFRSGVYTTAYLQDAAGRLPSLSE
jgi:acetyl-CoA carboxylase biotin carboxylase subunit